MNTATRLEKLRLAIHGVSAPFFCAGSCVLKNSLALRLKDGTQFVVERAESTFKQELALQPLIDRCQPATFGDKRRNRLDRNVRDAVQLKAENFSVENFDPESMGILDAIRREMFPPDSPPVTAELYALNIYTQGGHFASHKDTPRGSDMFGTLVVCLPSHFWDGQLKLIQRGLVEQFDWGTDIRGQRKETQLHWVGFFGDVDHQIERVGGGARVTLTYLLRRSDPSLPSRTLAEKDLAPAIHEAWRGLLADPSFLPEGGIFGYHCGHLYHQDARFQVQQKPLDQRSANMLKGRDQLVAAAALQAGLGVTFAPYLYENCVDETWQLGRFPTSKEKEKLTDQMDLSDLESALPIVGQSNEKVGDFGVTWLEARPSSSNVVKVTGHEGDAEFPTAGRLHSCEYCEWGYFGNEASDVDFYIYAALHIHIPAFGKGLRAEIPPAASRRRKAVDTTRSTKKKTSAAKNPTATPKKKAVNQPKKPALKTPRKRSQ